MTDPDDLFARYRRAVEARSFNDNELRLCFEHAAPVCGADFGQTTARSERRTAKIYDAGPRRAVRDAAAQTQSDVVPPMARWFNFDLAPWMWRQVEQSGGDRQDIAELLDDATETFFAEIATSNFVKEIGPALKSAHIAAGCLMFNEAPAGAPSAYDFRAVPLHLLFPEDTAFAAPRTIWRCQRIPPAEIAELWPDAAMPDELTRIVADRPREPVEIVDGAVWDGAAARFEYVVLWRGSAAHRLLVRPLVHSPFVYFRMEAIPGEALGWGPVRDGLPDILSANKVTELVLRNAALAVTGIWQADDDGVVNPATIKLIPGAIIPKAVGSSGLTPLQSPGRFDVSELVMRDLRANIRDGILGRELPQVGMKSHVAATAVEREYETVLALRLPRQVALFDELVVPLARIGHDINVRRGTAPDFAAFGLGTVGRGVTPAPVGPWVRAARIAEVMQGAQALGMLAQINPVAAQQVAARPAFIRWVLENGGLPARLIPGDDELVAARDAADQQGEAAATAAMARDAAPALKAIIGGEGREGQGGGGQGNE